ncbi:lysophospholipid acyltransferase family protein [Alisedimentitalea sp. MJ-SS2]|uniref:lysophospholipid acyltransferase family protein n=1 Tax=Aliisedimentitalea sp. MJ-SS2 TaxID=3049795 RepID=UPI0029073A91|nr:lysophospholipid acyltransferase family protein [Alisedimentitalea sp. MJ-SS2]MDU8926983.1 lysophospholipid acyltransferase family protein [Alisedimentitalea sp. MJ-SS2]
MLWEEGEYPEKPEFGLIDRLRGLIKGLTLVVLIFGGLFVLILVRLVERPIYGLHRPWTPWIPQGVCAGTLKVMGIAYHAKGKRMDLHGTVVANHGSWLDIFVLNARKRAYFVSKSEVAKWPGIGWLAKATGTVFINRNPREAKAQQAVFESRLLAGHKLLFFPEGTSTDGKRVLPFKPTLFQAFFSPHLEHEVYIQPVTVVYRAPEDQEPRFYGWWGEMDFAPHLWQVLCARRQGSVTVIYHDPLKVDDFTGRKPLAAACEAAVRAGMEREVAG